MAFSAFLQSDDTASRRSSPRRLLRLHAVGAAEGSPETRVLVHDISQGGLLLECDVPLGTGEKLQIDLPEAGTVEARVAWTSGRFVGCRFARELPGAAISAALLRSSPVSVSPPAGTELDAASEVRELQARIQQLLKVTDAPPATPDQSSPEADAALSDEAEMAPEDERLSFGWRMRIILGASLSCWALILWAADVF